MNTDTPKFEQWYSQQPKKQKCSEHPEIECLLSERRTRRWEQRSEYEHHWTAEYEACPKCAEEKTIDRLKRADVPPALLHCTFDNWTPPTGQEDHLRIAKEFSSLDRGFLVLLGAVGTGKSHLAIACLRAASRWGVFVKQSTLLRQLRMTYKDDHAKDPVKRCQDTELLILDEMGLSGGGRDEAPMLHEILDHRYNRKKPTILTSNFTWDELRNELGERLSDRLKEAAFGVLVLSGASHRGDRHADYFRTEIPSYPVDMRQVF